MGTSHCYPEKAPKVNLLLDTLSNNINREICHYFENHASSDTATLDVIVTHVTNRVPGVAPTNIRTKLHHVHLPKLEERGWLDYDPHSRTIRYHGHEHAERLLSDLLAVFEQ